MRSLAKFGAVLIESGVAVVSAAAGMVAGGLRKYASHGQVETPVAEPKAKAPAK